MTTQASTSYVWDSDSVIAVVNPPGRSHCEGPQPGGGTRRPKGRISSLLLETAEHPCDMAGHGRAASPTLDRNPGGGANPSDGTLQRTGLGRGLCRLRASPDVSLGWVRDDACGEVKEVAVDLAQVPHLVFQLSHADPQLVLAAQDILGKGRGAQTGPGFCGGGGSDLCPALKAIVPTVQDGERGRR